MEIIKIILSSLNRLCMCHLKTWSKFLSMEFEITFFTISLKTIIYRLSAVIRKFKLRGQAIPSQRVFQSLLSEMCFLHLLNKM